MDSVNEQLWTALGTVLDPELDRPITDLGFVASASVDGAHATVRLRLPTYFCAPNFAYLMVADARDAVAALSDVSTVDIELVDHFAAAEINAGVAGGTGFAGSFPGEATGELEELRLTFRRKAYLASLDRLASHLDTDPVGLTLGEVPESPALSSFLHRRAELGLPCTPDSPLLLDEHGAVIGAAEAPLRLRFARAVRVSIDGNAGLCRGLLHTRYPEVVSG
ncbi:iron-sulfur cluster assembly protein [Actinophytocola sp.]|uniref:iron-sulfur cluster assembly protein n=1 Tax=Actinophytocola sp. TaxID=1872138 RepID=UPI003D6C401B